MEIEFQTKVIEITENLQAEIEAFVRDGWSLIPGLKPVAIYPVQRLKHRPQAPVGLTATITIDESKVQILRDGKLIDG